LGGAKNDKLKSIIVKGINISMLNMFEKYEGSFDNWSVREIENTDIGMNSNKSYIGLGYGMDKGQPKIEQAVFIIYLYNNRLNKGFTVINFMNISKNHML